MQGVTSAFGGDAPGARLGKYQLIRRLATGGMAEIFLARAQAIHGFEKLVVLKRILPQHAQSEDFIRMFLAEARLAARLHHPNIVQVYDIGEEASTYFFTMEYVQGQDLRRLVRAARRKQTPIPLEHILHVIMGMAGGLHHAHEKMGSDGQPLGIVHRDVSPSNVLVTYDGDVKVVDFGIAKAAAAQVSTIAGTLKGKIPYMSPEQCRGEAVDRRSDIFSIGTLLWELTTGKRLFAGENEFAILNRVAKADVPPPSSIRPQYPPELEAIVMRALAMRPEDRYMTAIDLQIDLEDFAREARLPVSSARMGRFMRKLFEDDIRTTATELQSAPPSAAPGGTMIVAPGALEAGIADLTPSEVRQHAAPTPGLAHEDYNVGSGTDISVGSVPGRSRGPAIAVGAGFLLTLGLGGGLWVMSSGDTTASTPANADVQGQIEITPLEDEPGAAAADPLDGAHGADDAPDARQDADAQNDDALDVVAADEPNAGGDSAVEVDGAAVPKDAADAKPDDTAPNAQDGSAAPDTPDEPADDKRTASGRKRPSKRSRSSVSKKKPPKSDPEPAVAPETKKKKKPKYNADSAILPGI